MKKLIFGLVLAGWVVLQAHAAEAEWLTSLPKAQEIAKEQNKLVLMDFTGSDWCPWCIKLHKDVFSTPEFKEYADKNLALVEVDFPQKKKLSNEQQKANDALASKYSIEAYPTVIVLNKKGKKVGKLGYESDPKAFIAKLEKLKAKN